MRRALLMSLVLHLLGFVLVAVAGRPRLSVPPRMQAIPVDFIPLAAPARALTERARPASAPMLADRPRSAPPQPANVVPDPLKPRPRREPSPRPDPPREEPAREPESKPPVKSPPSPALKSPPKPAPDPPPKPQPDLARQGSADTTQVLRSELPRVGDLRGAMQMRVEGEVQPYAYYLSIVQRKIASFWEPPAGIPQQSGDVGVIVRFRIEKDGAVWSDYVEEPSGISVFDTSARRALARAQPLPPLPGDYPGDHLIIHLRFVYGRETGIPAGTR